MPFPFPPTAESAILTVTELNRTARQVLEQAFPLLWVSGEISNLVRAASGHWYFSLKDSQAQVRCAMFRHKSQYLDWVPENGMQVEVRALVTLYEARGDFQLTVETMRRSGLGALYEAFETLKQRLAQEGLFADAHKRPLPPFPRHIGIVTSPDAAALRDVLTTLKRRMPSLPAILYPTPVQGEGAAEKIAAAIRTAGARRECDVLILCRGGGSIEDLWQFNQEIVARAVYDSPIPVVCGVGHETDFTIADFVADRRAPTPTAAAEMASPNCGDLLHRLAALAARIERRMEQELGQRMQHVDHLSRRLLHPGERINARRQHLDHLRQRLNQAAAYSMDGRIWHLRQLSRRLAAARPDTARLQARQKELGERLQLGLERHMHQRQATLQRLAASLHHLNPHAVLERGFSIVETAGGEIVRNSGQLAADDEIRLTFARGKATARVTGKS